MTSDVGKHLNFSWWPWTTFVVVLLLLDRLLHEKTPFTSTSSLPSLRWRLDIDILIIAPSPTQQWSGGGDAACTDIVRDTGLNTQWRPKTEGPVWPTKQSMDRAWRVSKAQECVVRRWAVPEERVESEGSCALFMNYAWPFCQIQEELCYLNMSYETGEKILIPLISLVTKYTN